MDYGAIAKQFFEIARKDPHEAEQSHRKWLMEHSTHEGLCLLYALEAQSQELRRRLVQKEYIYMITFTVDPKKHPHPDEDKIEEYVVSQAHRSALKIFDAYYVREHHADGRAHWHMCLKTTKALRSDAFKHYSRVYGRVDISRTHIQNDSEIVAYLTKESNPKKIQIVGSNP